LEAVEHPDLPEKPLEIPSDIGARVTCAKCNVAVLFHPTFDWRLNPDPKDHFTEISKFALDNGWAWEAKDDKWIFICQRCIEVKEEALNKDLPRYVKNNSCCKCGGNDVSVKFCYGRENCNFGAPRDHLHRMCRKCGYKWVEGCLDDPKTFTIKRGKNESRDS